MCSTTWRNSPWGIDYWTSCLREAKVTVAVPAAQWPCCLSRFCPRRCDAVHKPGTPSACSPQLLLSFSATTRQSDSSHSLWLCNYPSIRGVGPTQNRTDQNVLTWVLSGKLCSTSFSVYSSHHGTSMMLFFDGALIFFFFCVRSNINLHK